jgi:hypothetical protein
MNDRIGDSDLFFWSARDKSVVFCDLLVFLVHSAAAWDGLYIMIIVKQKSARKRSGEAKKNCCLNDRSSLHKVISLFH